jgi:four helix bundle protein
MASAVRSFRGLKIWQRAMDLVPQVCHVAQLLPPHERFGLMDQMRRAAVSVPSSIAEGQARRHTKEFIQHLSIARGSLAELQTLLLVAERLQYLNRETIAPIETVILDVLMPLSALIARLQQSS